MAGGVQLVYLVCLVYTIHRTAAWSGYVPYIKPPGAPSRYLCHVKVENFYHGGYAHSCTEAARKCAARHGTDPTECYRKGGNVHKATVLFNDGYCHKSFSYCVVWQYDPHLHSEKRFEPLNRER